MKVGLPHPGEMGAVVGRVPHAREIAVLHPRFVDGGIVAGWRWIGEMEEIAHTFAAARVCRT